MNYTTTNTTANLNTISGGYSTNHQYITFDELEACKKWISGIGKSHQCCTKEISLLKVGIMDVNIIVPNKVVEVTFLDGTKEKSVCREPDVFSLETAISICISKKIMGGSSAYNKAIKNAIKVYEDKLKKEALDKAEQERIAKKRAKRQAYKERRAAKREQIEKEKQIEIQKEAYIRAMKSIQEDK